MSAYSVHPGFVCKLQQLNTLCTSRVLCSSSGEMIVGPKRVVFMDGPCLVCIISTVKLLV